MPRPRLLRRLDDGAGAVLGVVSAPAGFGKTTLLRQWAAQRPTPPAWVTLEARHAEPSALWHDVLAELGAPRGSLPTGQQAVVLAAEQLGGALVLDGYEHLVGSPAEASLWRFACDRPWSFQVVVSGRSEPAFPLASLRARGELVELRARDLRLTDTEARELVSAAGRELAPADADEIVDRCGGWAAALRLAADAGSVPVADAALRELVLQLLAGRDDERQLLVECSILDELSGPLCDAVTGRRRSADVLAAIERDNLFVEPADDAVLRVHPVARRALCAELERTAPRTVPRLHRRAAAWYRGAGGDPQREIEHLLACGDLHAASVRAAHSWPGPAGAGEHARALAWLDRLPSDPDHARLALARGWLLRVDGRHAESDAWLDAARRSAPPRARPSIVRSCALARAVVPWDDVGQALVLARRAWRYERGGARRGVAAWAVGWSAWWSGDDEAAQSALLDALAGPPLVAIAAHSVLARIALARGDLAGAGELVEQASLGVEAARLEELPALGMLATAAGAVAAERGEGASALALLERGVRLRRTWGHPLETADALIVVAPVAAALNGRRAAAELLAEARLLVAACPDPGALQARLDDAARAALPRPTTYRTGDALTPRERTVLRLLARGHSKREIAGELFVSFNTVHSHTKAIYRKLGASSREEAIERMRKLGLY